MTRRLGVALVCLMAGGAMRAEGQSSLYGVRGVGFPGRPLSVRALSLGGGPAAFDRGSAINPATVVGFPQVTAMFVMGTEFRGYDAGGVSAGGIRTTRFPLMIVGGRAGRSVGFALSVASYAERSYDVTTVDTLMLRGTPVAVADRLISDGGIADLRGAVAWEIHPRWRVGLGLHAVNGSARLSARRTFSDSLYRSYRQDTRASFSAKGISGGVVATPMVGVQIAGVVRVDSRLDATIDSTPAGGYGLPATVTGGVLLAPAQGIRLTSTVAWRSWSNARADLRAEGAFAFDTWDIGTGIELGGAATGTSRVPLRLGFRYALLPFAATRRQAHETGFALGTGIVFAGTRGLIDVALERVLRSGSGANERAWLLSMGMTVRP